ncbi:hypothetical protein H5410_040988 [Solanum commersonii]|uniref:CCHC-type domain-containing protein n=1 Tax=Solanum commersonii TaxID=4109 RepID=A0A9J5XRQ5_SOLCO|nr:hypothetical protein H5410_040988 [Solanum commersonii]
MKDNNWENFVNNSLWISLKQVQKIRSILLRTNLPKIIIKNGRKEELRRKKGEMNLIRKKKRFYKSRRKFDKADNCHKCGRFGHYVRDCRVKEKIKNLDIDDNIKESLCKIMLNSDSGKSEAEYSSHEESSTSEDLKALHQEDYMSSDDDCLPCQQGLSCEMKGDEDDLYKIYSQFKELSINVIDNDKVIELLQIVKNPEIRAQIIDKISNTFTSQNHITEDVPTKEGSYTMAEVKNLMYVLNVFLYRILNLLDFEMVYQDPEGKIHGQEIIDLINTTMDKYQIIERSKPQVDDLSPFKQIARKLQMKKGLISKSKAIANQN